MAGLTDLSVLLASMEPAVRPGHFTVVTTASPEPPCAAVAEAMVREDEGVTYVLPLGEAERLGLPVDFVAAWIGLRVHSSLEAVGLTAAVAAALGAEGISCNVLAAYFHDHLLVPADRVDDALAALRRLAEVSRVAAEGR
jgi:uncharacterized protein